MVSTAAPAAPTFLVERSLTRPARPESRAIWPRVAAVLLILFGFWLRLYRIDYQSIWWDEGFSYHAATLGYADLVQFAATQDTHPLLYHLTLKWWMGAVGDSELALRYLSLIPGVLSLALIHVLGRRLGGPTVGLLALALLVVSPFHVAYSQEARMYALVTLLAIAATLALTRAVRDRGWRPWLVWGVLFGLGLQTHYSIILVAAGWGVWLIVRILAEWSEGGARTLSGALLGTAVAAIVFLPWLPAGIQQVVSFESPATEPLTLTTVLWRLIRYGLGGPLFEGDRPDSFWFGPASLTLALAFVLTFWLGYRRSRRSRWAVWLAPCLVLLPLAAYVPILMRKPMFHPRYLLVLLPYVLLTLAFAASHQNVPWRRARALILIPSLALSWSGLTGYYFDPAAQKDQVREMVAYIEQQATKRNVSPVALVDTDAYSMDYYIRGRFPLYPLGNSAPAKVIEAFRAASVHAPFFYHVTWFKTGSDSLEMVPYLGLRYGEPGEVRRFLGGTVSEYRLLRGPDGEELPPLVPSGELYGSALRLIGRTTGAGGQGDFSAGGHLWTVLRWRLEESTRTDYRVGLRLVNAAGHEFGTSDRTLVTADQRYTSRWSPGEEQLGFLALEIDPGAPPGDYQLTATVYDRRDPTKSLEHDQPGDPTHRYLPIASIRLDPPATPPTDPRLPELRGTPADLGPMRWLGRGPVGDRYRTGDRFELPVYWQAIAPIPAGAVAVIEAIAPDGSRSPLGTPTRIGSPTFPANQWSVGIIQRDYLKARLPGDLPAGTYELAARVRTGEAEWTAPLDARIAVDVAERSRTIPALDQPLGRAFGPAIRLVGWSSPGGGEAGTWPRPNGQLPITLVWQSTGETEVDYTVFVQVLGPDGRLLAQHDAPPAAGAWPTSTWVAAQVVEDPHLLTLPADLPRGRYRVIAGLYDPRTGTRLKPEGGVEDYVELFARDVP